MKRLFPFLLACLFFSCKKNKCGTPESLTITHNSPVVQGWDLHLQTDATQGYRIWWFGPNGWAIQPQTISTDANLATRTTMTLQDAGEYTAQWIDNDGCVKYEGKVNINVITPPSAPCSIAANSSQSSVVGVGSYTFGFSTFASTSSYYTVTGSAAGGFVRFGFWGQTRPKPGVYDISGGFFGDEYGTTGLFIQDGPYQFLAQTGKAYVTQNANGKLSVSICGIKFSNPINPSVPITVDANVTER